MKTYPTFVSLVFQQLLSADEVGAQRYEGVFVQLWDRIRNADAAGTFAVLASFSFTGKLSLVKPDAPESLEPAIRLTTFEPDQR